MTDVSMPYLFVVDGYSRDNDRKERENENKLHHNGGYWCDSLLWVPSELILWNQTDGGSQKEYAMPDDPCVRILLDKCT